MKYVRFGILTLIVMVAEFAISYLVAHKFDFQLLDVMFFLGLFFTLFFFFFSSSGGLFTNYSERVVATSFLGVKNNYKLKRTFESININCFNFGSLLFFLIGFVVAFSY